MPRIGSLRFDSTGVVTLSIRPLNMSFQLFENEGIPSGIPRQRNYSLIEPDISDFLSFQDNPSCSTSGMLSMTKKTVKCSFMRHVWETGSFWYFHAIKVPKGMYRVFNGNVQPLFNEEHCGGSVFDRVFFWYWGFKAQGLIEKKLKDKENYVTQIKEAFGAFGKTVDTLS